MTPGLLPTRPRRAAVLHGRRRRLIVLLLILAATAGIGVQGATAAQSASVAQSTYPALPAQLPRVSPKVADDQPNTLFVGVAGLTWQDISPETTPTLYRLAQTGSVGSLTARSVRASSCPVDGWLGLSAGRRAADVPAASCRMPAEPETSAVPNWSSYLERAKADHYDAKPGLLGDRLAGLETAAIGPGAAIGLANRDGLIEDYSPVPAATGALQNLVSTKLDRVDLLVLDLGNAAGTGSPAAHQEQLRTIDQRLGSALAGAGSGTSVMVASLADGSGTAQMQFAATQTPDVPPALLTSQSTRQPGLIQALDFTPTLLAQFDRDVPESLAGARLTPVAHSPESAAERIQSMHDRQNAVHAQLNLSVWFFPVFCFLMIGLGATAVFTVRNHRERVLPLVKSVGLFFASVPISTYLVNLAPWERAANAEFAMIGWIVAFAGVLTAVALLGPWKRKLIGPLGAVAAVTTATLAIDVLTGSSLQMSTLMGEPLLTASRFYGIGNSAYALFTTALVLSIVALLQLPYFAKRPAVRAGVVIVIGILAAILLGTPGLGTKFGSIPTIVIGFALLTLAAAGLRLTIRRAAIIVVGAAALMVALLYLDWLRPVSDRTHFGRFFATILEGEAGGVLWRKVDMNMAILTQNWMTLLLPIAVALVVLLVAAPARFRLPTLTRAYQTVPLLKTGLLSLFVLLILGSIFNDSGIVVPAVGILMLIPAIAHVSAAQAMLDDAGATPPTTNVRSLSASTPR
ncbi:hypothetical protein LWF01_03720 [Saxibacter everestensis]|uniref:Uncharacterized protein n=1 Tax=Saxibacter everestensis TaxID=2909229 RepID=A0ABY8QV76_9MICO|nr:hypothetical protein LWF01_03720 [Brevibacteriaceae bacterium ZFBP1038]